MKKPPAEGRGRRREPLGFSEGVEGPLYLYDVKSLIIKCFKVWCPSVVFTRMDPFLLFRSFAALAVALSLFACNDTRSTGPSPAQQAVNAIVFGVHLDASWPISSPLSPEPREPFVISTCAFDAAGHAVIRHYAGFDINYDDRILARAGRLTS